jgi:hypothetical protein
VGEIPPVASYKNPWDLPTQKKEESKDEKKEENWQDEKYNYEEDFGELLVGKKKAAIFVYDLISNTCKQVYGIPEHVSP